MWLLFQTVGHESWSSNAEKTIFWGIVRVSFGYRFFPDYLLGKFWWNYCDDDHTPGYALQNLNQWIKGCPVIARAALRIKVHCQTAKQQLTVTFFWLRWTPTASPPLKLCKAKDKFRERSFASTFFWGFDTPSKCTGQPALSSWKVRLTSFGSCTANQAQL